MDGTVLDVCVVVVPKGSCSARLHADPHAVRPSLGVLVVPLCSLPYHGLVVQKGMTKSLTIVRRLHVVRVCRVGRRRNLPRPHLHEAP
jgi:hypothetical protein